MTIKASKNPLCSKREVFRPDLLRGPKGKRVTRKLCFLIVEVKPQAVNSKKRLTSGLLSPDAGFDDKAIADAADCQQVLGFGWLCFDVLPETHDEVVDGARVRVFTQSPDIFEHRFA